MNPFRLGSVSKVSPWLCHRLWRDPAKSGGKVSPWKSFRKTLVRDGMISRVPRQGVNWSQKRAPRLRVERPFTISLLCIFS